MENLKYYIFYQIIYQYHINNISYIYRLFYYIFISSNKGFNQSILQINRLCNIKNFIVYNSLIIDIIYILYLKMNYQLLYLYIIGVYLLIFQLIIISALYLLYQYKVKSFINQYSYLYKEHKDEKI